MTTKERIFHAVLFEIVALLLMVPLAAIFLEKDATPMLLIGILLSVLAVVWNYFYNIGFDRYFGAAREKRSLVMRVGHALGFEAGLILVTVPLIAYVLSIGLWAALLLDAALLIFFFVYAIIFNWVYDQIKYQLTMKNQLKKLQGECIEKPAA